MAARSHIQTMKRAPLSLKAQALALLARREHSRAEVVERLLVLLRQAASQGCDLVVFPELAVTGYPPEDLLLRPGFVRAARDTLNEIAGAIADRYEYHAVSGWLQHTIVNGRVLMENRQGIGVDENEIRAKFHEKAHALKQRSLG